MKILKGSIASVLKRPELLATMAAIGVIIEYADLLSAQWPMAGFFGFLVAAFLGVFISANVVSYFFLETLDSSRIGFFSKVAGKVYWPFVGLHFLVIVCWAVFSFIFMRFLLPAQGKTFLMISAAVFGALSFFCRPACLFGKGRVFSSLSRAFGSAFSLPGVFLLAAAAVYLDASLNGKFDPLVYPFTGVVSLILSKLVLSFLFCVFYKVVISAYASSLDEAANKELVDSYLADASGNVPAHDPAVESGRGNACLVLGFLSFIPLVHLAALYIGIKRFRGQDSGRTRALFGAVLGGFFTLMYSLLIFAAVTSVKDTKPVHLSTIEKYLADPGISKELRTGLLAVKQGRYYEAVSVLNPERDLSEVKYLALGIAYQKIGDSGKAIEALSKCAGFPEHNGEAYFYLGLAHLGPYSLDKTDEAENSFKKFLERYPKDEEAQKYLDLINNRIVRKDSLPAGILVAVVFLISLSFHEFSHAYTAYKRGDFTQKDSGRMSMNPLRHIDLFGSIILPGFLIAAKSELIFGWAKPVIIAPENFKDPKKDDMRVSVMGPAANFLLAFVGMIALTLTGLILVKVYPDLKSLNYFMPFSFSSLSGLPAAKFWIYFNMFWAEMVLINIIIGVFNLLPFPPLDGSWILPKLLPDNLRPVYENFRQYSFIFLMVFLFFHVLDLILGVALGPYFIFMNSVVAPIIGLG